MLKGGPERLLEEVLRLLRGGPKEEELQKERRANQKVTKGGHQRPGEELVRS